MISFSALSGFYTLTNLLINLLFKNENNSKNKTFANDPFKIIEISDSIFSDNLSILKLYEQFITTRINFQNPLIIAVKNEYYDILKYSFDSPFRQKIIFSDENALELIKESLKNTNLNMFHYLKEKFVNEEKLIKDFPNPHDESVLTSACSSGNLENVTMIYESIYQKNPNIDCSNSFFTAASKGYDKICSFLINKNTNISFDIIFKYISSISTINKEMVSFLYDFANEEEKEKFIVIFLIAFIKNKNYEAVEFLFEKNAPHDDALFEAVKISDEKMVKLILKYDNSPSFINRNSEEGTALNIAVKSNNYNITKLLLSIKGINPSLYGKDYLTPLMSAFQNFNIDIINLFFEFYGEDIQTQTFQFNESFKFILKTLIDKDKAKEDKSKEFDNKHKLAFSFNFKPQISTTQLTKSKYKITDKEISVIKKLLEIKNIDINYQYNNYSLLSYSCINNLIDIVSILVGLENCNLNQYSPIDGNTPLILSIIFKNIEIINLLLKSPKININQSNYKEESALTLAVFNELSDIVDLIINDPRFDSKENLLNYSFSISNNSISQKLISHKDFDVNLICKSSKVHKTILINAVSDKNTEKVKMIIQHPTFDPIKSRIKEAIFESARRGTVEIFRILLPLINNDINILFSNESLLTVSSLNNREEIVHEILNNPNFDPQKSKINDAFAYSFNSAFIFNNNKIGDILINSDKNHLIIFEKLLPDGKSYFTKPNSLTEEGVKYFLDHGVNPDTPDAFGIYPLEHAIEHFNFISISALIDSNKIDLKRRLTKKLNSTYLHLAAQKDDKNFTFNIGNIVQNTLKKIIDLDVIDVNEVDQNGETPLMYAVRNKNRKNVNFLFQRKDLDFLKQNNKGDDALAIAINNFSSESWQDPPKSKEDYLQMLLYYIPTEQ